MSFRSWLKIAGIFIVVLVAAFALYVARTWDRVYASPLPDDIRPSTDPATIARGEYLVYGPAHCVECHTASVEEYDKFFTGGPRPALTGGFQFALGPLGTLYSKNLTPDPETGIGRYTDGQVARMLRHNVRPDGRASITETGEAVGVMLAKMTPELSKDATYERQDRPKNLLRWDLTLKPGTNGEKATTVDYQFRLEYARDVNVGNFKARK